MSQWAWEEGNGWTHTPPTPLGRHTSRLQPGGRLHPGCPTWEGKQVAQPSKAPGSWPEALLPGLPDQDSVTTGSQLLVQGLERQTCTVIWSHYTALRGLVTVGGSRSTANQHGWPTVHGTRAQVSSMSLKDEQPVGALEAPGQRISEPCREWPVVREGTRVILSEAFVKWGQRHGLQDAAFPGYVHILAASGGGGASKRGFWARGLSAELSVSCGEGNRL